mmetsp:Transcript_54460/g.122489  ORF Transcript_54460/g.122489 Transcript_54460/m.122489 type:complete len:340 (-) Transcript_54460:161-1180(-)
MVLTGLEILYKLGHDARLLQWKLFRHAVRHKAAHLLLLCVRRIVVKVDHEAEDWLVFGDHLRKSELLSVVTPPTLGNEVCVEADLNCLCRLSGCASSGQEEPRVQLVVLVRVHRGTPTVLPAGRRVVLRLAEVERGLRGSGIFSVGVLLGRSGRLELLLNRICALALDVRPENACPPCTFHFRSLQARDLVPVVHREPEQEPDLQEHLLHELRAHVLEPDEAAPAPHVQCLRAEPDEVCHRLVPEGENVCPAEVGALLDHSHIEPEHAGLHRRPQAHRPGATDKDLEFAEVDASCLVRRELLATNQGLVELREHPLLLEVQLWQQGSLHPLVHSGALQL